MVLSRKSSGVTLIEMVISLLVIVVLGIGVSSIVRVGIESQMAQRTQENMQIVAMNIVDDLRFDLRTADSIAITGGGNTLSINGGQTVYSLNGAGDLVRQQNGNAKTYNDGFRPALQVVCPNGCFQSVPPKQVLLPNLRVQQTTAGNTIIDRNFGLPNFPVRNVAFDIMSATQFD